MMMKYMPANGSDRSIQDVSSYNYIFFSIESKIRIQSTR